MRKISIVGAGQAGLILAHKLLRAGYRVAVYSDRNAEDWLERSTPTGTAYVYGENVDIEESLGLGGWSELAPPGDGVHLSFCPTVGNELMEIHGRFKRRGYAVDQRLKNSKWLTEFTSRGGELHIEEVTLDGLEKIARESDLTYLAAGKGAISAVIPRDPERSVYDKPQRVLTMLIATGVRGWLGRCPFQPVKFNFFGDAGECFWVPYYHKSVGHTWCVLFEAKPGGPMDAFGEAKTGEQVVEIAKRVVKDLVPWDFDVIKDMELAGNDPFSWLNGKFPPTVRKAFGKLPSGRLVAPVGDTAMLFDPIGGQGANNATRMASFYADRIVERGARPFDEQWLTDNFEAFWNGHGRAAYTFNNLLLEPLRPPAKEALLAASRSPAFADFFFGNFSTPNGFFPWVDDMAAARKKITEITGSPWIRSAMLGRANVAMGQIKQKFGRANFSRAV
ncbi:MAG: oxidoreductase [Acidipila sp.]|nr:oxidoreductase [Acidipila sp.]